MNGRAESEAASDAAAIAHELAATANPEIDAVPATRAPREASPTAMVSASELSQPDYATLDVRVTGRDDAKCNVTVDGRAVGSTPVVALEVPLGESPVQVVCSRRERFFDLLRFQPGDQLRVVVMVSEEAPKKPRKGRRKRRRGKQRR